MLTINLLFSFKSKQSGLANLGLWRCRWHSHTWRRKGTRKPEPNRQVNILLVYTHLYDLSDTSLRCSLDAIFAHKVKRDKTNMKNVFPDFREDIHVFKASLTFTELLVQCLQKIKSPEAKTFQSRVERNGTANIDTFLKLWNSSYTWSFTQ